jgi:6-phosphofructokinase 2
MPGPELSAEEYESCLAELSDLGSETRYVVASGSLPGGVPADFYGRAAKAAERAGLCFVLDTSGDPLCRGAEAGVYLLKPNLRELAELAGESIESESQQQAVAEELVRTGRSEVVVVSAGAAGVLLVTGEVTERIASPTVPIRSRVGAGDSMVAGIVFGLLQDMGIRDAVRYGVAAGAAAVMTPGSELCRADDAERLFQGMRQANRH